MWLVKFTTGGNGSRFSSKRGPQGETTLNAKCLTFKLCAVLLFFVPDLTFFVGLPYLTSSVGGNTLQVTQIRLLFFN